MMKKTRYEADKLCNPKRQSDSPADYKIRQVSICFLVVKSECSMVVHLKTHGHAESLSTLS